MIFFTFDETGQTAPLYYRYISYVIVTSLGHT